MITSKDIETRMWNFTETELVIGDSVEDTWGKVTYNPPVSESAVRQYLLLLVRELSLYPAGYLLQSGIKKIVIGRDLAFNNEYRGAIPDPYRKVLYLSVNGAYGESGETYLIHILHHEIHHMVEYSVWKNMFFEWTEWNRLNPEGFKYGRGGSVNKNIEIDYYTVTHPLNGFLNLYSMTGGEEDRCELAAFLMSAKERKHLLKYYKNDLILQRKVKFISDFINDFAGKVFIDIENYL